MSAFNTSKRLEPKDLLSSAISSIAKSQSSEEVLPKKASIAPAANDSPAAISELVTVDTETKTNATVVEAAGITVGTATITPNADPLNTSSSRSAFRKPIGVKTSSGPIAQTAPAQETAKPDVKEQAKTYQAKPEPVKEKKTLASVKSESKSLNEVRSDNSRRAVEGMDAKIILNSFRVFSPLVSAVAYAPGKDADSSKTSEGMGVMYRETEKLTVALCKLADIDILDPDKQWAVSQFRVLASEHVGTQWKRNPDAANFTADPYVEAFAEVANSKLVEADKPFFPDMSDSIRVRISVMKSLAPVIKEYGLFENVVAGMINGFKVDRKELFFTTSEIIQTEAKRLTDTLGLDVSDPAYLIAYQAMLNHCGASMASSVAYASDRMLEHLDTMSKDQQVAFFKKCISEKRSILIDMDAMVEDFKQSMDALVDVSNHALLKYSQRSVKNN